MRCVGMFASILFIAACAHQPDADAIRVAIMEAANAAQAQRSADILERISDDFTGNHGEFDRTQLARLLRFQLLGQKVIGVSVATIDVDLSGDRATARFDATFTDASGRWIADRRAELQFVTGWHREHGTWRCYNATWSGDPH